MLNLTAQQLFDFILTLKERGCDLTKVEVKFRHDFDSDVIPLRMVGEDLRDAENNSELESIIMVAEPDLD